MDSCSVEAVLKATDNGFTSAMNKAQNSLQGVGKDSVKAKKSIMDIATGIGVFKALSAVTSSLSNALDGAISRYDTMNRFPTVMKQMGFETEQSEQAIKRLSNGIDGLPTTLDGVVSTTQRLAATTGNLDKSVDTTIALNNALIASGATTDQTARATDQYIKILSTGKVEADSWQTLSETMSYALKEVAASFGYAGDSATNDLYAALKNGDVSVKEFNNRMIELSTQTGGFAEIAQTAAGGIATAFRNIQTAVVRGVEGMIRSIDEGLVANSLPNLQGVLDITKGYINDFFGAASSGAKGLVSVVAPAIKAVAGNLDILVPTAASATAGFVAFKAATNLSEHFGNLKKSITDTDAVLKEIKDSNAKWTLSSKDAQKAAEKQSEAAKAVEKAYEANEKSIIAAVQANQLDEAAKKASEKAAKAQTQAELLAKEATDKKKIASEASTNQEKLNEEAKKASEAASKAQARAELLSVEATKKQEMAQTAGATATKVKTAAETAAVEAEKAQTAATQASVIQLSLKQAVLAVLRGSLSAATVAQNALNAAWKANPLGVVITAVTTLVTALQALNKWLIKSNKGLQDTKKQTEKTCSAVDDLVDSIDSSADAHEANLRNIDAEASASESLVKKITDLVAKEELSKAEKQELDAMINQLNSSVEGLNLAYNEQTGALSMTDKAILSTVESYREQAKAQALQEHGTELIREQMAVADELKTVESDRVKVSGQLSETTTTLFGAGKELKKTDEELAEKEEALRQRQEELTVAVTDNEAAVKQNAEERAAAEQKVAEAAETSAQRQITSLEDLSESQQSVVETLNGTWQSYVDHATDMFDALSNEADITVAEMTENLQKNQQIISEWSDNIAILAQRGVDEGLLEQLRQAGPESAGYVKAMVDSSDTELQGLSDAFANGGQVATDALKTAFDTSGVPESAMGLVTKAKDSMATQIANADFASLGDATGQGYAEGINRISGQVEDAVGQMVHKGIISGQTAQDSNSPSVVYAGLGQDAVSGYVQGIQGSQGQIGGAMSSAIQTGIRAAETASKSGMSSIAKSTSSAFSGMNTAAKTGMSGMTSTVTSGMNSTKRIVDVAMKQSTQSVTTGMRNQNTQVTTGMRQIQTAASSGTSGFVRAITSGMNSAVSAVSSGKSQMVAQVNSLQSSFYASGVYASQGLARGINAGAGAAIAAARSVANSIAATMSHALDEHSPSKVTAQIGEYASEGAAIGLLNMLPLVRKASDQVAQVMIPQPATAARPAYAGVASNYDYSSRRSGNVTLILETDGRELGRVVAPFLEMENQKRAKIKTRIAGGR